MKKIFGWSAGVVAIVVALAWIAPAVRGAEDVKAAMEASNKLFTQAWEKKDAAGVAARYTADAELLPTGSEIIKGNAAILAFWKAGIEAGPAATAKFTTLEAEQHGETAIEVGQAELLDAQGKHLETVKYIVIWKKIEGQWKMHRDIWNTNTPAAH